MPSSGSSMGNADPNLNPISARRGSRSEGDAYPSPFFDMARLYLPNDIKQLLRYARYYFYAEPAIHSVIRKMAEYSITDVIIESKISKSEDKWRETFRELNFKSTLIEVGLNYYGYGNCFITPYFPQKKYLICPTCEKRNTVHDLSDLSYRNETLVGICPNCDAKKEFVVKEEYQRTKVKKINILMWDPLQMDITYNEITGEKDYYYNITNEEQRRIQELDPDYIEYTPMEFIKAAFDDKRVDIDNDMIYHLHRKTLAQRGSGWGRPLHYPVMKYLYYLSTLRKSQEVIANERAVPKRFLYPESNGAANPVQVQNLGFWKNETKEALERWRDDPAYVHFFPQPLGEGALGGDAKTLLLTPEINNTIQQIITGMGVPQEFVFGGLQWTGSSISLRMIENKILNYREQLQDVVEFLTDKIGDFLELPSADFRFQEFKMADDMQRKKLAMGLNQKQKVSDTTILEELGFDFENEIEKMIEESDKKDDLVQKQILSSARMKGLMSKILSKYKLDTQEEMMERKMNMQKSMQQSGAMAKKQMSNQKTQNIAQGAGDIMQDVGLTAEGQRKALSQIGQQVTGQLDKLIGDGSGMVQDKTMQAVEEGLGGIGE